MASRPIWRGLLRLALVSCPVAMFNARHDRATLSFNMINPATGNRIKMVTRDAETGQELKRSDTVKGYEYAKGKYLLLSDEDIQSVKVESSDVLKIEHFVDAGSIDPMYYDSSFYLAPDGKGGEDVYAVLREAIEKTGKMALSRVVISQRERTVAIRPMKGGLMAHTLHDDRDINRAEDYFEDAAQIKTEPEMVQLATQLIQRQSVKFNPAYLEDKYESRMRAMIDAKVKGMELDSDDDEPAPIRANVIDLVAALKKSLGQTPPPATRAGKASKKPVAKTSEAPRPPPVKVPRKRA